MLTFTPVEHPDPPVRRLGFDLSDPHVEQCWSAVVGPSATLLLRRLPTLWIAQVPAEIRASDLSRSLGLGGGVGEHSRLATTMGRLVRYGLARPPVHGAGLDVYRQVAPLRPHQLARLPEWSRDTEDRILGTHLSQLEDSNDNRANVVSITARLDRLQHGHGPGSHGPTPNGPGLER